MATKKPSKYKFTPDMCDRMIELGKEGASQKMMFSEIGINKDVAARWKKEIPEFEDALSTATIKLT